MRPSFGMARKGLEGMARSDRSKPRTVLALAPGDRTEFISLQVSVSTLVRVIDDHLNAKLGEYAGLVHGDAYEGGTDGLLIAVALFQGLRRPVVDRGIDESIYVYVLDPPHNYNFPNHYKFGDAGFMNQGPQRVAKPESSAFVVYADIPKAANQSDLGAPLRSECQHPRNSLISRVHMTILVSRFFAKRC